MNYEIFSKYLTQQKQDFLLENIFSGGTNMGFLVLMKIWDVITKHRKENRARKRPVMWKAIICPIDTLEIAQNLFWVKIYSVIIWLIPLMIFWISSWIFGWDILNILWFQVPSTEQYQLILCKHVFKWQLICTVMTKHYYVILNPLSI